MADMTDAQKKRQEARRKRRSQSEKPKPEQDDSSDTQRSDTQNGEPLEAVKQAAKVAAAGAAVGAAAAAARAFAHHGNDGGNEQQTAEPEGDEPEAEAQQDDEPKAEQPEEQQPEAQQPEAQQPEAQLQDEPEPAPAAPKPEPVQGASLGEAGKAMRTARDQLQELLGKAVESASALERTKNGWVTTLEVVEVSRIPETTDVLASYELELDENLGLRSYRQVRRYSRSQAQRDDQ